MIFRSLVTAAAILALAGSVAAETFTIGSPDDPVVGGSTINIASSSSDWNPSGGFVGAFVIFTNSADPNISFVVTQDETGLAITGADLTGSVASLNLGGAKNVDRAQLQVVKQNPFTPQNYYSSNLLIVDSSANDALPTMGEWGALMTAGLLGLAVLALRRRRA